MTTFHSTNPPGRPRSSGATRAHGRPTSTGPCTAAEAQRAWAARPVPARAEVIAAAGAVLADARPSSPSWSSREAGKVRIEAGGDVQEAIDMAAFVAGQGRSPWGDTVPSEMLGRRWRGPRAARSASSG